MNKKVFIHITAVFCAFYFFFAGTGVNIIKYCCIGCADEGIEMVASKSCNTIHHHDQYQHDSCCAHDTDNHVDDIACSDVHHQADGCHLLRLQTDVPSISVTTSNHYIDFGIHLDLPYMVLNSLHEDIVSVQKTFRAPPQQFLTCSGRDILTQHAVLLI